MDVLFNTRLTGALMQWVHGLHRTTARMQEVEQRREQLPSGLYPLI
ncbi:MAG: hypothetical protein V3R41_01220 [Gammaproteobacteria bacterium]